MASSEFHSELKALLDREWTGYGAANRTVAFSGDKVNDLLAEHEAAMEEIVHLETLARALEVNLQEMGKALEQTRGELKAARGETIVFDWAGQFVLSDADMDRLARRVGEKISQGDTHKVHRPGIWLTASDPEPPYGSAVREEDGVCWERTGGGPAGWERNDRDGFDPESWTRVCENGPVRLLWRGGGEE